MGLCFVYLLSYFTRISCWFHFVCGATAFNTFWAQMEVSLSVGDRPNGLKKVIVWVTFLLFLCADH